MCRERLWAQIWPEKRGTEGGPAVLLQRTVFRHVQWVKVNALPIAEGKHKTQTRQCLRARHDVGRCLLSLLVRKGTLCSCAKYYCRRIAPHPVHHPPSAYRATVNRLICAVAPQRRRKTGEGIARSCISQMHKNEKRVLTSLHFSSASSYLAAGVSGVVSVSSQAHSMQSDNGCETRSIASGSSWSLLSALQLEPLSNAASGPYAAPGMLQMSPNLPLALEILVN